MLLSPSLSISHPLPLLLESVNFMTLQLNIKVFQDYIRLVNKLLFFLFVFSSPPSINKFPPSFLSFTFSFRVARTCTGNNKQYFLQCASSTTSAIYAVKKH